eukprot:COSAG02_NODE_4982_length_4751_cov_8.305245_1_plen_87_part_00
MHQCTPESINILPRVPVRRYMNQIATSGRRSIMKTGEDSRDERGRASYSLYAGAGGDLRPLPLAVGARGALGQDVIRRTGGKTRGP